MKKVILWAGALLLAALAWYLFIKPYDYLVRFEVKTSPGDVNQMVKIWNSSLTNKGSVKQISLTELEQSLKFGDSVHHYEWEISRLNDSTSKVRVYTRDENFSLQNKIGIPFSDTDFEKRSRKTVRDFMEKLQEHIESFKVTFLGEANIPEKYAAYTSMTTTQYGKAAGMMRDHNYIGGELLKHQVELDGPPMVEITDWDMINDSIHFNFLYPIKYSDSLPELGEIQFKKIEQVKALKAEFNGNYIFSDRAWYELRDYAEKKGLKVTDKPLEIFYNNPNMGGDELQWKADIYMPLAEDDD